MLIDRKNLHLHLFWIAVFVAGTIAAAAWYAIEAAAQAVLPGGSSRPGFTFGIIGGLICLFEFLLWPRKKARTLRVGRVQTWLRAHIWLGLLSLPVLVLHSGFYFGGPLSSVLMVLFLAVIASGVWGLALQQFVPRLMLDQVPAETIYSQIEHVMAISSEEAERLVLETCGPAPGALPAAGSADRAGRGSYQTVGAVRAAGRVQGKVLQTRVAREPVPGSEPLWAFYQESVKPFLRDGAAAGSPLRHRNRAEAMFRDLKTKLDPAAHEAVDSLAGLCDQRRQYGHQARLHVLLHSWLLIHLPLSAALIVLMFVHIVYALKFL